MQMCYINMDRKLIKNGGRKAIAISKEDFLKKLAQIHKKNKDYLSEVEEGFNFDKFSEEDISYSVLTELPKVAKDISKIIFDNENNYVNNSSTPLIDERNPLLGIHTLDNGLTFLGCMAGGDWESPIFFVIYHDGKDFRGYIPSYGNVYNLDFKTAFGSEQERDNYEDILIKKKYLDEMKYLEIEPIENYGYSNGESITDIYMRKQGLSPKYIPIVNWTAVKEDIESRIVID